MKEAFWTKKKFFWIFVTKIPKKIEIRMRKGSPDQHTGWSVYHYRMADRPAQPCDLLFAQFCIFLLKSPGFSNNLVLECSLPYNMIIINEFCGIWTFFSCAKIANFAFEAQITTLWVYDKFTCPDVVIWGVSQQNCTYFRKLLQHWFFVIFSAVSKFTFFFSVWIVTTVSDQCLNMDLFLNLLHFQKLKNQTDEYSVRYISLLNTIHLTVSVSICLADASAVGGCTACRTTIKRHAGITRGRSGRLRNIATMGNCRGYRLFGSVASRRLRLKGVVLMNTFRASS